MKRNNHKILVLGTGNAQYDFINLCKKLGFKVYSCSNLKGGRGVDESDEFAEIDITDILSIAEYVESHEIDVIHTIGSDLAMLSMVQVSEKLNLPTFIDSEIALTCAHKLSFRKKIKSYPEYSVTHQELNSDTDLNSWKLFPAIVKPNDSQGQRGISEISSPDQLENAYNKAIKHSQSKSAIIEEIVNGFEISINLYVVDSKIKFQFTTERLSFDDYPGGIVKSHRYPIREMIDLAEIDRMVYILISELGIKNGPVYLQVMITDEGTPKVIEVTPRMDGCHLWRMIYQLKGINLLEILIKHLTTGSIDDKVFKLKSNVNRKEALLDFFIKKPNSTFLRNDYNVSANAVFLEWFYKDGDKVRKINGHQEKVGYQLIF